MTREQHLIRSLGDNPRTVVPGPSGARTAHRRSPRNNITSAGARQAEAPFTLDPAAMFAQTRPGIWTEALRRRGATRGANLPDTDAIPEFDYIIVGAGSAGCLLANRLSADPGKRVLLLEAGGRDNWIWFHIPVGYLFAIGNPRSDWCSRPSRKPGLNGRSLNYPRGKVIGGSSAINAMIYMRGQAADYDHWRQLGLNGWGWDDVLPFFKQARKSFSRRERGACRRRRMADRRRRGCAGICSMHSAPRPNRPASNPSPISIAATTKAAAPFMSIRSAAAASRRRGRFLQAGAQSSQSAARDRLPGRRHRVRRQARHGRALAAERSDAHGALPRRSRARRRLDRFDANSAAVRHRARRSICGSTAFRSCSTSPASAPICRIICSCA